MLQMETVLIIDALKYHLCIDWDIQVLFELFVCIHICFLLKADLFTAKQNKTNKKFWKPG